MKEEKYSISEASRQLGVEKHVLRNWEDELELKIPRNEQGHRYYQEKEIRLLTCIKELKNKGFQLKAVKEVLPELMDDRKIDVNKLLAAQVRLEHTGETGSTGEYGNRNGDADSYPYSDSHFVSDSGSGRQGYADSNLGSGRQGHANSNSDLDSGRKESADRNGEVYIEKSQNSQGRIAEGKRKDKVLAFPAQKEPLSHNVSIRENETKMREFETIMGRIVGRALREQAQEMGDIMSDQICSRVAGVIDESLSEQTRLAEEHFQKLDEAIRMHQRARQEAAVTREESGKRKSRFFKKNKRKI